MSEWKKVENPVGDGAASPSPEETETAPAGSAFPEEAAPVPPHRPRKRRSDAGKKRPSPPETGAAEPSPASSAPASSEEDSEPASPAQEPAESTGRPSSPAGSPAPAEDAGKREAAEAAEAPAPAGGKSGRGRQKDPSAPAEAPEPRGGWTSPAAPPLKPDAAPSPEGTESALPADGGSSPAAEAALSSLRYTHSGRRKGRRIWAAPLGLLVLLLAIVGVVALVMTGIHAIQDAQDTTALKKEMEDFLLPVMQYNPTAFEDVNDSKQDALILAAIWRITEAERIRQLQEKDEGFSYASDDNGRLLIPLEEVEESYAYLFGEDAVPYHHTIGEEGMSFTFEYDEEQGCYHVPVTSSTSMYVPFVDTVKKRGNTVTVRVGYVLSTKIAIDDKGEEIPPTADDADHFQTYTVQQVGEDGWKLVSIANEGGSQSTTTTTAPAETTTDAAGTTTTQDPAATTGTSDTSDTSGTSAAA